MVITIAICDDEEAHRKLLRTYLSKALSKNTYNLIEFSSGEELIANYPQRLDLLLLDVQMKQINGLDTARKIREFDTSVTIIFTTAIIDFMQQGYEVRAFRYLLKPIQYEDFSKHILECIKDIDESYENHLTIKDNSIGEIIRIPINSILYVETEDRCVLIHTDTKIYKSRISINKIEKDLEESNFYRCHRSYLINVNKVKSLKQNSVLIREHEILVSRYKMKNLKLKLTESLGDLLC
ncbi:LytR/AlgR family response regulator transcription factor [Paraclostridium sordellii]|uniref:LytR/AlgR family response regulator transcription factor n=1 Tax=Paraclostridium sordellii TaxID=1505 RepID=UPI0005E53511|nr:MULTISPECIES: LytTR family DNA-binding domain-containing protein [Paeniclostridium]MBW4861504.1 LytTR family DNA-binding domain-containing protein [Paeniclostridium sp.]MBW4874908.1 LytTR family DNA-binding domain-containing protein [Paeniclostridium sp.]CEN93602.1 LytR family DNA-binding response regulator [[Clostridium] sordellii] [Paeniclostridium sordellii]CEN94667.1 LytR family DNA-binding response regulator [[Clostridium] sordellii] [Paeniclostridium sordellii]CEO29341.1 LytR family D